MIEICPLCHKPNIPIDVAGSIQCNQCGQKYSTCCEGEQAQAIAQSIYKLEPAQQDENNKIDGSGDITKSNE